MTTANRVVFGNTLMKYSAETISNFILAFTVGDKKLEYLELSSEWNKYVEFDRHRCCLVARDSNRNRIIKKFNLKWKEKKEKNSCRSFVKHRCHSWTL